MKGLKNLPGQGAVKSEPAVMEPFTPRPVDVKRAGRIIPAPTGFEGKLSTLAVAKVPGTLKTPENLSEVDPFDPGTFSGQQIKMTYGTDKNPQISGVKSKIIFHFLQGVLLLQKNASKVQLQTLLC